MTALLELFRRRRPEVDPAARAARDHARQALAAAQDRWPEVTRLAAAARRAARPT